MRNLLFQTIIALISVFVIAGCGKVEVPTPPESGGDDAGTTAIGCENDSDCEQDD